MGEGAREIFFPRPSPIVFPFELGSDSLTSRSTNKTHSYKNKRQLRGLSPRLAWAVQRGVRLKIVWKNFLHFDLITAC